MQERSYSYQYPRLFNLLLFRESCLNWGIVLFGKGWLVGIAYDSLAAFTVSTINSFISIIFLAFDVVSRKDKGHFLLAYRKSWKLFEILLDSIEKSGQGRGWVALGVGRQLGLTLRVLCIVVDGAW